MTGPKGHLLVSLSVLLLLVLLRGSASAAEAPCDGSGGCEPPLGVSATASEAQGRQDAPVAGTGAADSALKALVGAEQSSTLPPDAPAADELQAVHASSLDTDGRKAGDAPREAEGLNTTGAGLLTLPTPEAVPADGTEQKAPADGDTAPAPPEAAAEDEFEDRHNFALAKDGAKVVAANKEARKPGALLDADADTFLRNECRADKWVIVELSQVTKMDTLLLSQNELYSSRVREFELRGRQSHPRADGGDYARSLNASAWQLLGRFNASNAKGSQAFKLERPAWVKFLQLRQLSHYGSEAVCALNALCVFGHSAAEDLEARLHLEPEAEEELPPHAAATAEPSSPGPQLPPMDTIPAAAMPAANATEMPAAEQQLAAAAGEAAGSGPAAEHESAADDPPATPAESSLSSPGDASPPLQPQPSAVPEPPGLTLLPEPVDAQPTEAAAQPRIVPEAAEPEPVVLLPEEQLPSNSAGSAASRHGGSLYDVIVQELKAIKVQQKAGARVLAQLQRNVTAVMGGFALELDRLAARFHRIAPEPPALLPGPAAGEPGPRLQQCRAHVVQSPSELELLQQEVAALKQAVAQSRRQADGMLLAVAFSLLGGIGAGLLLGGRGRRGGLAHVLLCCTAVPPALAAALWVGGGALFSQAAQCRS